MERQPGLLRYEGNTTLDKSNTLQKTSEYIFFFTDSTDVIVCKAITGLAPIV